MGVLSSKLVDNQLEVFLKPCLDVLDLYDLVVLHLGEDLGLGGSH